MEGNYLNQKERYTSKKKDSTLREPILMWKLYPINIWRPSGVMFTIRGERSMAKVALADRWIFWFKQLIGRRQKYGHGAEGMEHGVMVERWEGRRAGWYPEVQIVRTVSLLGLLGLLGLLDC